jgi:6-pyruvoyltetrahydropterin/6-carboxytetrahydropterin synthase
MTLFPDGSKERLHGHNFRVSVSLDLASRAPEKLVDLGQIKAALSEQCAAWDQRLLLPRFSPRFQLLRQDGGECEFNLSGRHYVVPADEVLLLPLDNVVVETLAELFAQMLLGRLLTFIPRGEVSHLEVTLTESEGLGASFALALPPASRAD